MNPKIRTAFVWLMAGIALGVAAVTLLDIRSVMHTMLGGNADTTKPSYSLVLHVLYRCVSPVRYLVSFLLWPIAFGLIRKRPWVSRVAGYYLGGCCLLLLFELIIPSVGVFFRADLWPSFLSRLSVAKDWGLACLLRFTWPLSLWLVSRLALEPQTPLGSHSLNDAVLPGKPASMVESHQKCALAIALSGIVFIIFLWLVVAGQDFERQKRRERAQTKRIEVVVASTNLVAGTILTGKVIGVKVYKSESFDGKGCVDPSDWLGLIGHRIVKDVECGAPIKWHDTDIVNTNTVPLPGS